MVKLVVNKSVDAVGRQAWQVDAYDARTWFGQVAYGVEMDGEVSWAINPDLPGGLTQEEVHAFVSNATLPDSGADSFTAARDVSQLPPAAPTYLNGDDDD